MTTIPKLAAVLQDVLTRTAETAAVASGFVQRRSKLSGAAFVQTLSRMAGVLGVPISAQGLDRRFTSAAATRRQQVLAAAVRRLVAAEPVAIPLLQRFSGAYVQDSTVIALPAAFAEEWPGCGNASTPAADGASVKCQVRLELTRGELAGPVPHPGRVHDRAAPEVGPALPAGALPGGETVSQERLARADRTLPVTNVPVERPSVQEALMLAPARWQIELLFKLWKPHGHLATSRSLEPDRRLCERFAKLPALLAQHCLFLVSCRRFPDRSLVRAAQVVRQFALAIASASVAQLATTIRRLTNALDTGARIDRRRQRPGSRQLLLALNDALDATPNSLAAA